MRELRRQMVQSFVEISLVTRITCAWCAGKSSPRMTRSAVGGAMSAEQLKVRFCVIERRRSPDYYGVTSCAIMRKLGGVVVRNPCDRELCLMTGKAICWSTCESGIRMARETVNRLVCALKREICFCVIERRGSPAIHGMACQTIVRELPALVIRSQHPHKLGPMTLVTIGGRPGEFRILMTRKTVNGQMRSDELKIRLPMFEDRRPPSVGGVTCCAVVRKLSALMVGHRHFWEIFPMASETVGRCPGKP